MWVLLIRYFDKDLVLFPSLGLRRTHTTDSWGRYCR